jgi:formylglycine-generating enzyme required for sulfatase activity
MLEAVVEPYQRVGPTRYLSPMEASLLIFASLLLSILPAYPTGTSAWLRQRQEEFVRWKARHVGTATVMPHQSGMADAQAPGHITESTHGRESSRYLPEVWDAPIAPKMRVVPAGNFVMGSPAWELQRNANESQHAVTIRYSFAIGQYDVTRGEYSAFVASTGYVSKDPDGCFTYNGKEWALNKAADWERPGMGQSNDDPVVCVSWHDAESYAEWISQQTGHHYRLMSESEYEYVARAGTTTAYWWGCSVGYGRANCGDCGSQWDRQRTSPGGSFQPNPFGLYDMNGNVWQWMGDCWNESYRNAPTDGSPSESGNCELQVQRGGGWTNISKYSRAAQRSWDRTVIRNADNGFRLARDL